MDNIIVIESDESENSIIEIEVPKKPTPPLIIIEDEEIILNIQGKNQESVLAKDFIENDKKLSVMSTVPKSSSSLNSPDHWTSDMIKFYNDDWGDEKDFTVEKLQEKMDKNPSLWNVSRKGKAQFQRNMRKSHIKCWNCGERGHHISLCPDPPRVVKCHMCGTEGHAEYLCPNSKCLNCGNKSREYVTCCVKCQSQMNEICSRCQLIGHNFINCTDHWRLFHLTTGTTSVKIPDKNIHKPAHDMWCCNCGRRGHNQIWCKKRKDCGAFADSFPFVSSYEKTLNFSQVKRKPNVSDMSLKKGKGNNERIDNSEKVLKLNPLNKAVKKDKMKIKNRLKKIKRNKKNKNKKKGSQRFFDGLLI